MNKKSEIIFGKGSKEIMNLQDKFYGMISRSRASPASIVGALITTLTSYLMAIKQDDPVVAHRLLVEVKKMLKNVEE